MSAEGEVLMPVSTPDAAKMAEIHAMRQMADAVQAQTKFFGDAMAAHTRAIEKLDERVAEQNDRLIRLEEQKHGREIEGLRGDLKDIAKRVDGLEGDRDQRRGAKALLDIVRQNLPWLGGALLAFIAMGGAKILT